MGGGDVLVAAETGSGKTGAFALPSIHLSHEIRRAARDRARKPKELPAAAMVQGVAIPPILAKGSDGRPSPHAGSSESEPDADVSRHLRLNSNDRSPLLAVNSEGTTC